MSKYITAAQARLNFCPKVFEEVMVNINQAITAMSRTDRTVEVLVPTVDGTHTHVREALEANGFNVFSEKISSDQFKLRIKW